MGRRTRRTGRLIAKSAGCQKLVLHPIVLSALEQAFRGGCYDFQLHGTSATCIDPGESAQSLHRDDSLFPFRHPCPPSSFVGIWAIDDFQKDNGATRLIPGSHRWNDETKPEEDQCLFAEMPKGSVLLFDAALHHGGGANVSTQTRTGVIISYSLGWLRQEENQYLAVPPALARTLPPRLRELVGYKNHGFLGHFELGSPERALADLVSDVYPAQDLYTAELEAQAGRRR
jgi:ectoine hydroxylase-related dioxygenase (phytanoyl-CoA dioxygenase family)